jgi:hypothetical protein
MEKRFFIISLLMLFAVPAFAELTVEDTVNPEFLKNSGYSQATINVTQKIIAQDNGETLTEATEKEYYNNKYVKPIRRFFMYIDPSLDDHSFMNDHNIHTSPSINDL